MIIALFILAVAIGYLRKGRLKNLAVLKIKLIPFLLFAFIIQMGIYFGYKYQIVMVQDYDILLHFVSYIILFAGLMANFNNKWFIPITLGVVLNFMVIFLNGGKMPVSFDAASVIGMSADNMTALLATRAGTHQQLQGGALLWFLSDILPVSFPKPLNFFNNIYSIGDFVMYLGMMGLVQSAMVHRIEEEEEFEEIIPPTRVFESFHAENHLDEIYIHDKEVAVNQGIHKVSASNEETIVLNMDPSDLHRDESQNSNQNLDLEQKEEIESSLVSEELQQETEQSEEKDAYIIDTSFFDNSPILEEEPEQAPAFIEVDPINTEVVEEVTQTLVEMKKDEREVLSEEIDRIHQFIIVDGKITENPNYNKNYTNLLDTKTTETFEIEDRVNQLEEEVEELEMFQVELAPKINFTEIDNQHLLQKISDNERVDLMKKMRERKEKGYNLVEVKVGDKKINFWQKEI